MPRLAPPDPPLPLLFTRAQAMSAGLSRDQVRHRVRSGRWVYLGQDVYRRTDWQPGPGLDDFDRARIEHAHRAVAAVRGNPGCVIGFQSAAVLHRLRLVEGLPPYVVLIAPPGHWSGRRPGLLIRRMTVSTDDFAGGAVPVTTAGRTWLDIACTATLADGLAAGDAGLRDGILDRETLARLVDEAGSRAGIRRARVAVQHVDALRETPLESASWAYFVVHDLPLPRMQVEIRDRNGRLIGRVDFAWDESRLVGEADGRLKYDAPDALYREKLRDDRLREHGHRVIRWGWADLRDDALARRLRVALSRPPLPY